MSAKKVAYVAADVDGGWAVSICVQGENGHRPVQNYSGPYTVEVAEGIASRLNRRLGLDEGQARMIILTTMPSFHGAAPIRKRGCEVACACGHAEEEHGHDPKYPGSSACTECVDCIAFEDDGEEDDEEAESASTG